MDETTETEEFDDLDYEDEEPEEPVVEPEPVAKKTKKAKAPEPVAETPATPDQSALAEYGVNALKAAWASEAKNAGYVAADYNSIGLTGLEDADRMKFLAAAKASHEQRIEELAAIGFVYKPEEKLAVDAQAVQDAADAEAAKAWGPSGPGATATGTEQLAQTIQDEVKSGDTMGVIGSLFEGGLGNFWGLKRN